MKTKKETIDHFLAFMRAHYHENMFYDAETGCLHTRNCEDEYSIGCCSQQFDLDSLFEALDQSDPPTGN